MSPDRERPAVACGPASSSRSPVIDRPLAILAGGGQLPAEIAREVMAAGGQPRIVALAGISDADFTGLPVTTVGLGQIGRMLEALKRDATTDMVIAGHVRRPDLARLRIDIGFVRHLPTILGLLRGGDDRVMRRIAAFFERQGLTVHGFREVAPALLAPLGAITGHADPADTAALEEARRAVRLLGPYDIGQTIIMEDGKLAAIEGAEGTDATLARLPPSTGRRVFVKTAKPGQDIRLDLPTIGPSTVESAGRAGVQTLALEAGYCAIAARAATLAAANERAIALLGVALDDRTPVLTPREIDARAAQITFHNASGKAIRGAYSNDAGFAMGLIDDLAEITRLHAILIARRHILAVNLNEEMLAFIARTGNLGQWGDRRRKRRNVTLAMAPGASLHPDLIQSLTSTPVAAIAVDWRASPDAAHDEQRSAAGEAGIILMERR